MIVAPLMTPILGIVLAVALTDGPNLRRCLLLVIAGAAAVVALGWLLGLFVPYPVVAQTNAQVAARTTAHALGASDPWHQHEAASECQHPASAGCGYGRPGRECRSRRATMERPATRGLPRAPARRLA
jgi:hypothetical protein